MIRTLLFFCGLILAPFSGALAQETPDTVPARIVDGDTIALIDLKAYMAFPPTDSRFKRSSIPYDRLVYHVRKVYPYAKLAGEKLAEFNRALDTIPTERARKAYLRKAEKELEDKFGPQVKELTFTQGKILIKLIYRQTGSTSFELVKELRGKFNAFIWQTLASLFGYDLKTLYDPVHDPQDQQIERIVIAIEEDAL